MALTQAWLFFFHWPAATEIKRSLPTNWRKVKKARRGKGTCPQVGNKVHLPRQHCCGCQAMKQDEQVSRPGFSSWVSAQLLVVHDVNACWLSSFPGWDHESCQMSFKASRNSCYLPLSSICLPFFKDKKQLVYGTTSHSVVPLWQTLDTNA